MPVLLDARPYGSDRDEYMLAHYARVFAPLVDRGVRLLEIGVRGGSLRFWADYFPTGRIVGLDMAPIDLRERPERVTIYQGLQQDMNLLTRIAGECAPDGFDVIIDDASHIGALTRVSFWHLLTRHLKPGGIFAIEDWGTGYWDTWPDGRRAADADLPGQMTPGATTTDVTEFPSHTAGLVGVLKEIVDEVGMYDLSRTGPGTEPARASRIDRLEILPGIAFVTRAAGD
jgi:SAM-dependent methyltransferase